VAFRIRQLPHLLVIHVSPGFGFAGQTMFAIQFHQFHAGIEARLLHFTIRQAGEVPAAGINFAGYGVQAFVPAAQL
jgi:hypothetical protein